jgi:hypothetical protein
MVTQDILWNNYNGGKVMERRFLKHWSQNIWEPHALSLKNFEVSNDFIT